MAGVMSLMKDKWNKLVYNLEKKDVSSRADLDGLKEVLSDILEDIEDYGSDIENTDVTDNEKLLNYLLVLRANALSLSDQFDELSEMLGKVVSENFNS